MSHITTCPNCSTRLRVSEQITDKTMICPHCLADVDNPQPGFQIRAADIDTDVKRDVSLVSIALHVLIGLCVLGIAMAFFSPRQGEQGLGRALWLAMLFVVLDILVGIAIIRVLVRWGVSGVRTPSAGRVLGITFLSLGTIVAVILFFFFTCMFLVD